MTTFTETTTHEVHEVLGVTAGLLQEQPDKTKEVASQCHTRPSGGLISKRFAILLVLLQLLLIILFAVFADYKAPEAKVHVTNPTPANYENPLLTHYPLFLDLHVMVFVGLGLLVVFLNKYGYSSLGFNLVLAAFAIQFYIIFAGLLRLNLDTYTIPIDISSLSKADFSDVALIIALGALYGKLTLGQYLIGAIFAIGFYAVNEYIVYDLLTLNDPGRALTVHIFGAYFGLTTARVIYKQVASGHENESPLYTSDILAAVGTLFLWVFWPSFNAASSADEIQHRVVVNTYLALAASCLLAFAMSALLNANGKLDMFHIQNATLAGGVHIAASANLLVSPFGAMIIGAVAGVVTVFGFKFIAPLLLKKLRLHDSRGVHFLHGLPGIVGALVAAVFTGFTTKDTYGDSVFTIFPSMKSGNGVTEEEVRTPWNQAGMQLAGVGIALAFALVGGLITGFLLRLKVFHALHGEEYYDDCAFWRVAKKGECRCLHHELQQV